MVTLVRGLLGCTVIAAIALLYVECRDWAGTDTRPRGKVESTAVGEMRHFRLNDGSRVDLNTNSQISTRVEDNRRVASLTRGEAHFQVAENARAAFLVLAGNANLESNNADFSVRIVNDEQVDLLVKTGRVDVRILNSHPALAGLRLAPLFVLTATSGESISLRANSVYARERLSTAIFDRRTAWTSGWLWFINEPLPQALREFNRYHRQQLVLVDPDLAALRIGGRFRSSDVDSFVASLQRSFDIQATTTSIPGEHATTIRLSERCPRAMQQCN